MEPKKENAIGGRLDYGEAAGAGFDSTKSKDYSLPQLWVLQKGHPQCKANNRAYVPDAVPGMLYLPAQKKLIDPELGLIYVFVRKTECYVEQVPFEQRGDEPGFVAVHQVTSQAVTDARERAKLDPKQSKKRYPDLYTPEGNELIQTDNLFGYSLEDENSIEPSHQVVIPIQSTKFEASKQMFDALAALRLRIGNMPTFALRFRIGTKVRKATKGDDSWNLDFKPLSRAAHASYDTGLIQPKLNGEMHPLLAFGMGMNEAIKKDEIGVDYSQGAGAGGDEKASTADTAGF